MPKPPINLPTQCPNCAAAVHGPYCAQCGQETAIGVPTLAEMGHEYIQTFVSLEGRLWRTLWLLLRWPGRLSTEFLAGRRRRYVRPLPLYLSLSALFFLAFSLTSPQLLDLDLPDNKAALVAPKGKEAEKAWEDAVLLDGDMPAWVQSFLAHYQEALRHFHRDPKGSVKLLSEAFISKLPIAVFFMVPIFALVTKVLYWRRRRAYAEHLLLALHLHAFAFLVLLLVQLTPGLSEGPWLFWVWWVYLALALRQVFGGRLTPQVARALVIMFGHAVALALAMALVALLVFPSIR